MNKIFNVGLVGCGHISETYFRAEEYFNNIKIIKCADINNDAAEKCAKVNGIKAINIDDIFKNKSESANPKFETVIGNNNKAEANIAGITPAVLILSGK